jgi:tetratricopeptide (TPR) repeat protein
LAFVPRIDLLTRLELFLRKKDLAPLMLADAAVYSRQHVLRVRLGKMMPTRRFIVDVTSACERLSREAVTPGALFERGDELLASSYQRLGRLFVRELRVLDNLLGNVAEEKLAESLLATDVRSETAVAYLLRKGQSRIDQNPAEAAAIFHAAAVMAADLPPTAPELVGSLQAHALKGRANALRHLGAFDAALADLVLAANLFLNARYCTSEAGQVEYTRATVLFKMERWAEAMAATHRARSRFVATGDARRAVHADLLKAGILFQQGDVHGARDMWLRLLSILAELKDVETLSRVWQNLGACEIRRGHAKEARHWLRQAAATFRALGNETELARTRWNIATYVATFKDRERGISALEHAQRAFVDLGLYADAGCVGLEILELLIQTAAPNAALTRYAQAVAEILVRAGLDVSAAAALDHLRRIARARNKGEVLRDVRAALRELDMPCRPAGRDCVEAGALPGLAPNLPVRN